jgi:hypothetical protein
MCEWLALIGGSAFTENSHRHDPGRRFRGHRVDDQIVIGASDSAVQTRTTYRA